MQSRSVSDESAQIWWIWAGVQCVTVRRDAALVNSVTGKASPGRRPVGKPAAYHWRGCRGIVGHLIREPVCSERGNHPWSPNLPLSHSGGGQVRCRLKATRWDGGPVVVGARESRAQGEGVQQVSSRRTGMSGGRR